MIGPPPEVATHADAIHKLGWYARRWSTEPFLKTLKSGCRIEEVRLTTADRLANCIALCLAHRHAPPGATVLWQGFSRLADLAEGFATRKTQQPLTGNWKAVDGSHKII